MRHRTLAELEQTLLGSSSGQTVEPPPDAVARCQEFAAAYHSRKHQQAPEDRPLRAYLLLDRWDDSAVAAQLTEVWPEAAESRAAVPDTFYAGREGEAPCVVPLPEIALPDGGTNTLAQARAQEILAEWLQAASRQAHKRLAPQDLCAMLFSTDSADWVAQHLAKLGFQYAPGGTSVRMFRYQDPRVMQRVWPELSAAQQSMWLGPIQIWWSLIQPWGPWAPEDLMESGERTGPPADWFKAEQPTVPVEKTGGVMLNRLLNAEQWHAAHASAWGHRSWAALASARTPVTQQPDGATMSAAIARGQRLGLDDQDLDAFIELSWLLPGEEHAGHAQARSWDDASNRQALEQALHQMRNQQGLRFTSAWLNTRTSSRP
ncbi:DUF4123 domain-containing protein [Ralstonia holmesii]|nr:DUF4123 domain-containing protein [Ralstonia sp. LMG 32967]CAJ0820218.1 hypothetical protein LMG18093_04292 [Ralstonia sp. LMG 32967]